MNLDVNNWYKKGHRFKYWWGAPGHLGSKSIQPGSSMDHQFKNIDWHAMSSISTISLIFMSSIFRLSNHRLLYHQIINFQFNGVIRLSSTFTISDCQIIDCRALRSSIYTLSTSSISNHPSIIKSWTSIGSSTNCYAIRSSTSINFHALQSLWLRIFNADTNPSFPKLP